MSETILPVTPELDLMRALPTPLSAVDVSKSDSLSASQFADALVRAPALPEHALLRAAGGVAEATQGLPGKAFSAPGALTDPGRMLAEQKALSERMLTLELIAKVAGSASQAINKLTHMQ